MRQLTVLFIAFVLAGCGDIDIQGTAAQHLDTDPHNVLTVILVPDYADHFEAGLQQSLNEALNGCGIRSEFLALRPIAPNLSLNEDEEIAQKDSIKKQTSLSGADEVLSISETHNLTKGLRSETTFAITLVSVSPYHVLWHGTGKVDTNTGRAFGESLAQALVGAGELRPCALASKE